MKLITTSTETNEHRCLKRGEQGGGEMEPRLRALTAPLEELRSVPSTCRRQFTGMRLQLLLPGILRLWLPRVPALTRTFPHSDKCLHITKINDNKTGETRGMGECISSTADISPWGNT